MRETLLDRFAAAALTGILLRPTSPSTSQAASEAYTYASAMLRERAQWRETHSKESLKPLVPAESPEAPYGCEEDWYDSYSAQAENTEGS